MAAVKVSMAKPYIPTAGLLGAPAGQAGELAEAEKDLAAAKRAYAAVSSNALHLTPDLGIPAAALKVRPTQTPKAARRSRGMSVATRMITPPHPASSSTSQWDVEGALACRHSRRSFPTCRPPP